MTLLRIAACLTMAALLAAQPPAVFDAASIRPADPNSNRFGMGFSANGRTLTVDGLNLAQMAAMAWHVRAEELSFAPSLENAGWIRSDRYDINAKAEGTEPLSKEQQERLFQQLLADRFGLRIHNEKKEMTVYSLEPGKNGPKLSPGGTAGPYLSRPAPGKLVGQSASMKSLAGALTGALGRPVMDNTRLTGGFDFTLTWTPDTPGGPADASGVSLFSALEDQLGLKVESRKAPMHVIVVDQARKPSANLIFAAPANTEVPAQSKLTAG
jgi:uncharacterized protein (TIGR03435 family)